VDLIFSTQGALCTVSVFLFYILLIKVSKIANNVSTQRTRACYPWSGGSELMRSAVLTGTPASVVPRRLALRVIVCDSGFIEHRHTQTDRQTDRQAGGERDGEMEGVRDGRAVAVRRQSHLELVEV